MLLSLTFWVEAAQDIACAANRADGESGHALLKTTVRGVAISVSDAEAAPDELPWPLSTSAAVTEESDGFTITTRLPEVGVRLYHSSRVFRKDLCGE